MYAEGGPVMWLIVLVGLVGLLILLERIYVIVIRSKNNSRPFIERVIQLVRSGKVDEAIKECASSNAALPDMGLLILRSRSRDETDLQHVAAAAALSVVPRLSRRIQYLPMLALVGALLGLLGTVLGVRDALFATASLGSDRAQQLSIALAASLAPAAFGLVVAIVLSVGRSYLVSQSDSITAEIQEFSARLINALIDRPDVRLGHR
jgi:biopolymer transport protein ExbB/TolQ